MDNSKNSKSGFTLLETIIASAIMVMAFAILAVIFGKAYTISKTIKRGSTNQRWGAYIMNTILYGPGTTATEGLIAATRIYYPHSGGDYPTFTVASYDDSHSNPSRYLCFSTPGKKPLIYELANAANSLYRNISAGDTDYNPDDNDKHFDLKPTYAKEGKLEMCDSSGFYFYDEHNKEVTETKKIKRVGIKLVIKNAFQDINQAIILYQNVRIRNLYSSELQ